MYTIGGLTLHVFSAVHAGVPLCPQGPRRGGPACPNSGTACWGRPVACRPPVLRTTNQLCQGHLVQSGSWRRLTKPSQPATAQLTTPRAVHTTPSPPTSTDPTTGGAAKPAASLLQNKSPTVRGSSSGPEELGVLPEEEAAGHDEDEDREKEILIERIQSIKEEKQVSLCPLPALVCTIQPHPPIQPSLHYALWSQWARLSPAAQYPPHGALRS